MTRIESVIREAVDVLNTTKLHPSGHKTYIEELLCEIVALLRQSPTELIAIGDAMDKRRYAKVEDYRQVIRTALDATQCVGGVDIQIQIAAFQAVLNDELQDLRKQRTRTEEGDLV